MAGGKAANRIPCGAVLTVESRGAAQRFILPLQQVAYQTAMRPEFESWRGFISQTRLWNEADNFHSPVM